MKSVALKAVAQLLEEDSDSDSEEVDLLLQLSSRESHVHERTPGFVENTVPQMSDSTFQNNFRMSRDTFGKFCDLISLPLIQIVL